MDTFISAAAGLLGTVVGALITWLTTTHQRRLATTYEMHREFNSPEMIKSRHEAAELLEAHRDKNIAELRQALGPVQMQNVWNVVYFYQRLWLAVRHGGLHNAYVPDLFGDIFYWWYERSFQSQYIPLRTTISEDLDSLRKWMDKHTSEADRERWRQANRTFAMERHSENMTPSVSQNSD